MKRDEKAQVWSDDYGVYAVLDDWGVQMWRSEQRFWLNKDRAVSLAAAILARYEIKTK